MILVEVFNKENPGLVFRTYATMDDQSNHTLGNSKLFEFLGITEDKFPYSLETCHGKETCYGRRGLNLIVRSLDGNSFKLPTVIETNNIPENKDEIPTPESVAAIPHLAHIAKFLPPLDSTVGIDLLIGRDAPELLKVRQSVNGPAGAPWAQLLDLGWTVSGELCLDRIGGNVHVSVSSRRTNFGEQSIEWKPCDNQIRCKDEILTDSKRTTKYNPVFNDHAEPTSQQITNDVFHVSDLDSNFGLSVEDRLFLKSMENGFHKNQLGNWEAPLPFRNPDVSFPNNYAQVEKRFYNLVRNFHKNEQLKNDYFEFMGRILDRGHASKIPDDQLTVDEGKKWYIPHFAVYHPRKPTHLRVVFDASFEYGGTSLNKELLCGPDLMNRLVGRLIRFRQEYVAIMCDIEQMFYSFYVNPEDRTYLRFLWFKENNYSEPVVEYQMNVHIFGNGPSPAIATYGLRKAAYEKKDKFDAKALKFVYEDFYVDDGVYSCSTPNEAIQLIKSAQAMLQESNLRLHKVVSNVPEVMTSFPQADLAQSLMEIDLSHDRLPTQRTLGVIWDLERDIFTFHVSEKMKPCTRRGLLSIIHSLYDPLGFLAPVTITGRNILQTLVHTYSFKDNQLGWDDPLPPDLQEGWIQWLGNLNSIPDVQIPRCFKPQHFGTVKRTEIHGFSDASQDAIGIVVYLRLFNGDGDVHVSFLKGQAKVKPQRHLSIPRMELCAAVLLVTTVKDIKRDLEYNIDDVYYYIDSKVVLGYITNDSRRFYVYVANRIELIRSLTSPDSWRYVESEVNPSDIATRGCPASRLSNTTWFTGPAFLWEGGHTAFQLYPLDDADQDVRPEVKTRAVTVKDTTPCSLCSYYEHFGDWYKLCRYIALLKLICRRWKSSDTILELDPAIIQDAEIVILIHVQQKSFPEELSILNSTDSLKKKQLRGLKLYRLDPFIDQHGLIRVGGRIRRAEYSFTEKHPVVLPKQHHVTGLIIQHFHQETHHQGRSITHGAIRQAGYWILGGATLVNSFISKCFRCNYLRRPPEVTKMANLPKDRLHETAPFTHVGMDAFGPWDVTAKKTRGGLSCSRRWCIVFTCLASRAIHLEVVDSMDTAAFINALRRFTAIRGPVSTLRCDRGSNFIGAKNELEKALITMEDLQLKHFLLEHKCQWLWNPPHASHFGGIWERQIKTVRRVLEGMLLELGKSQLTHDLLVTLMTEVSAIVNSRPLTALSTDPDNPLPLSPGYLLTLKSRSYLPPPGDFSRPDLYSKNRWRRTQYLVDQFWVRWRKEYLQALQPRRKWTEITQNLRVNDVVLIIDESVSRGLWPKGRITDVKVSEDGIVRTADVAVFEDDKPGLPQLTGKFRTLTRPVSKLVFLCRNSD